MKKLRWVAAITGLFAALWFALPYLVDVNQYRGLIQDQLKAKLGRDVTLGAMDLSVLPLSIRIRDVSITEDRALASDRPFASVKELRVRLGLLALLSKKVEVSALTLTEPQVELIRKPDGTWNYSTLGSGGASGSESAATPSIDRLVIQDGAVGFTDRAVARPERQQYDHIDVDLRDFGAGRKYKLDAEAHLPGPGKPSIAWSGVETTGKLKLANVTVASLQQFLKQKDAADLDATLTGELEVESASRAKGKLTASDLRIKKNKLAFPVSMQFDVQHQADQKRTAINAVHIAAGNLKVSISGSLQDQYAKLKVLTEKSPIDELLKLATAFGAGADPGMQAKGFLTVDIAAEGPLEKLAYTGKLEATGLEVSNAKWKQPVKVAALTLALSPTEIKSSPFEIEAGATKLGGNFSVSNYSGADGAINASVKAAHASVAELLNVAQAFGAAAPGVAGSGVVDLDVQATGPMKKPRFSGKGRIQNAQFQLEGIAKPVAIPQLEARFAEDGVWIDQFSATLAGSKLQGSASIRDFSAPAVKFALDADSLNTTEMQKLFGNSSSPSGGSGGGGGSTAAKPSALTKATGGGSLKVGTLVIDDLVLNQLTATCTLDHGVMTLDPVRAGLFSGSLQGRIVADLRGASPAVTLKGKVDLVDANKLISAATPLKQTIFGKFGADTDLSLTANNDIAKSLNGGISLRLADGKLVGVNLLNEVSKFAKFFGWSAEPTNFTNFVKLGGTMKIVNGIVQTNDLLGEMNGAKFTGSGTINLVAQTLDLRLGMVLDAELSKKVGGNQIGGFMATALAGEGGQLMIPTMVRGSFAKPSVTPDAEQFAKLKLKSFASPSGLKGTADTVQGVMDLFRKKKDPPKQP